MKYLKKGLFLIVSTAAMVLLLLASGGKYLLPNYYFTYLMDSDIWGAVGGLFSMMLLPGAVVGFAACHSRVLGAFEFVIFVVCGFISGLNLWWIITAVLLVLSYLFCIQKHIGDYDNLEAYDKVSVLIPPIGAMRFTEAVRFKAALNIVGKVIGVICIILSVALPYFQLFAEQNMGTDSFYGKLMTDSAWVKALMDFGGTLFGVTLYYIFLPLCSVLLLKYLFFKPMIAKIYSFIVGGYNAYRGFFIFMPILFSVGRGGSTGYAEGGNPIFNNLFGLEAVFMMSMLIGGALCIRIAIARKCGFIAKVCMSKDGIASVKCILMAGLCSAIIFIISPAVIYIVWAILMLIFLFLSVACMNMVPEGKSNFDWEHYNMLRNQGVSENDAWTMARMKAMR